MQEILQSTTLLVNAAVKWVTLFATIKVPLLNINVGTIIIAVGIVKLLFSLGQKEW